MIEAIVSKFFGERNWQWSMKGGRRQVPTEQDVRDALDEAARQLYTEPVGTILQVGRLTFEKRHLNAIDVYMYVGEYI